MRKPSDQVILALIKAFSEIATAWIKHKYK